MQRFSADSTDFAVGYQHRSDMVGKLAGGAEPGRGRGRQSAAAARKGPAHVVQAQGGRLPPDSKVAATAFAALFRDVSDLPVAVLRLGMVYGPDEPNRHRLVPYVVDSLLRGEAPRLSSGRRRIDWVYVDDVVDAVLAAAVTPAAYGRMLDVGSASRYRSARWCR